MNSLFKKIALRISVLFLIVLIASGVISISHLDRTYKDSIRDNLMREARQIELIMISGTNAQEFAYNVDEIMDMRITIVDLNGTVVLDTQADAATLDNHIMRPEIVQAIVEGQGMNVRHSDTLKTDLMYTAIYSDPLQLVIRTSRSLEGISALSAQLWIPLVIVLVASLLLCLVIALAISRSITKPIIKLKDDTVRISNGQYDYDEPLKTGDEIEELSVALVEMVGALKGSIEEITEKNLRLEAVFQAIPGGIIAVDNDERVIMANPVAKEMFSIIGQPEGRHFIETAGHAKLESLLKDAMCTKDVLQREITIVRGMEEIYLQVFAVSVSGNGLTYGVILLAQDITRIRKLENMRSDFAANVSHELKTPLTVISGFIDTLKEGTISPQDTARFLDIISLESERLARLIDDVLALSEIENTAAMHESVIDIRKGTKEAVQLLEGKATEKQVDVGIHMPAETVLVAAEHDRVKQMVINLVDNAIKYTPSGGRVDVKLIKDPTRAVLTVADTGIGIPKDNLPRLFERFYRVDKSRSRALGGTGLGLAIVKHIVSLIGGHVTVDSEVNSGTVFHVFLPLHQKSSGSANRQ